MSERKMIERATRTLEPGDIEWLDGVLGAIEDNITASATHETRGRASRLRRLWREVTAGAPQAGAAGRQRRGPS